MDGNILVVDDNQHVLSALNQLLEPVMNKVLCIKTPDLIPGILETQVIDAIIMDMNFSRGATDGSEGIAWLKKVLALDPDAVVIMITAYSEMDLAIEAIKCGATDFISKPWDNDKLITTLRSGLLLRASRTRVRELKFKQDHLSTCINARQERLFGSSPEMMHVKEIIRKVAGSDSNILLLGENGTGKELIAREIHQLSKRADEVFVHVDMGAISETLFESELFGHMKGAFTDARQDKPGRIEIASRGTLFLDEIGNLQLDMQSKLLNVLQNREIFRLGSNRPIPVDFRLVAATNRDIRELISMKLFREDLYYRINTIEITAPPLRERGKDIPELAGYFLDRYKVKHNRPGLVFSSATLDLIRGYEWPGNVRQLQHSVERAVLMSDGRRIEPGDLLPGVSQGAGPSGMRLPTLAELEMMTIRDYIRQNRGNLTRVASDLGVARSTLYNKMKNYGIKPEYE